MYHENILSLTNDNYPPSLPPPASHERVGIFFDQLRGEIMNILNQDTSFHHQVAKLEQELVVYQRAFSNLDAEKCKLEKAKQEVEKQRDRLATQLMTKGNRVVALIDGDGLVFNPELIEQGQTGGHTAACKLTDSITRYIQSRMGGNEYQIWAYVLMNKRNLMNHLGHIGKAGAKLHFDEFLSGFSQTAERFMLVDVGSGKETVNAKMKALLESEIRMSQTEAVLFGGSHDSEYVTALWSHVAAGFKDKLILLQSFTEIAAGINELNLPVLNIPDLFISEKLGYMAMSNFPQATAVPSRDSRTDSRAQVEQRSVEMSSSKSADAEAPIGTPRLPVANTYSSILRASPRRAPPTPELESGGSTSSDVEEVSSNPRASPALSRRINPNLPISKQNPPPCTLFYLANCKHGASCRYGHDYLLQPEHYDIIRANAKKAPCPAINKGEICTWDEDCCYGHRCPQTTTCFYLKQGRCKFIGPDMHREPK